MALHLAARTALWSMGKLQRLVDAMAPSEQNSVTLHDLRLRPETHARITEGVRPVTGRLSTPYISLVREVLARARA